MFRTTHSTSATYYPKNPESGTALDGLDYRQARYYDSDLGLFLSVDPLGDYFTNYSTYHYAFNNPIRYVDPDGMAGQDWIQRADGTIYWDKNATSQQTTKEGEKYLGRDLTFTFNSYIDKKLWDGPVSLIGPHPAGDKLTSTIKVTGNANESGELINITATKRVKVGRTPWGTARDYFPGLGADQNKFTYSKSSNSDGTLATYKLNFEQHSSVSNFEHFGLNAMGFDIVNVAQNFQINYSGGNLRIIAATDVFPASTLTMNDKLLMYYQQPSFNATHQRVKTFNDNGMGGVEIMGTPRRLEPSFYTRFIR